MRIPYKKGTATQIRKYCSPASMPVMAIAAFSVLVLSMGSPSRAQIATESGAQKLRTLEDIGVLIEMLKPQEKAPQLTPVLITVKETIEVPGFYWNVTTKKFVRETTPGTGIFRTGTISILDPNDLGHQLRSIPYKIRMGGGIRPDESSRLFSPFFSGVHFALLRGDIPPETKVLTKFPPLLMIPQSWYSAALVLNGPSDLSSIVSALAQSPLGLALGVAYGKDSKSPDALLQVILKGGDSYSRACAASQAIVLSADLRNKLASEIRTGGTPDLVEPVAESLIISLRHDIITDADGQSLKDAIAGFYAANPGALEKSGLKEFIKNWGSKTP